MVDEGGAWGGEWCWGLGGSGLGGRQSGNGGLLAMAAAISSGVRGQGSRA